MGEPPKKKLKFWLVSVGLVLLIIIAISALILFFTKGNVVVTGEYQATESVRSIACEARGLGYPFFKYDNSIDKTITVKATFNNDSLNTIALVYMLYYTDEATVKTSEAENHAAMNLRFQSEALGADALGAKYARLTDGMKFSLYADKSEMNGRTIKYFLLDNISDYGIKTLIDKYQMLGLNCEVNN